MSSGEAGGEGGNPLSETAPGPQTYSFGQLFSVNNAKGGAHSMGVFQPSGGGQSSGLTPSLQEPDSNQTSTAGLTMVRAQQGNGNKRTKGEVDIDDILGQITQKLNGLSTAGGSSECSHLELLQIFMEVLDVDTEQAQFFLESANFNIEMAVSICMETQQHYSLAKHSEVLAHHHSRRHKTSSSVKYLPRTVEIVGLPPNWIARVSRHSGKIYFINTITNETQEAVPPGYADSPLDEEEQEEAEAAAAVAAVDVASGDVKMADQDGDEQGVEEEVNQGNDPSMATDAALG